MRGLSATTGQAIEGVAHLRQSLNDILSTPLGSRVMRRDYGSLLPRLIDQPATPALALRLVSATADAIRRWEPRLRLTRVAVAALAPGAWRLTLEGVRTDLPAPVAYGRLSLTLSSPAAAAA